jgi:SPP1 family predicted phage head-tail adaptor
MLASARLRHRILIEQWVLDIDTNGDAVQDPETGETTGQWVPLGQPVWAAIEPLSAREFIAAQATQSQITARIVIRHRSDLTSAMRLVHMVNSVRGTVYNPAGFLADKDSGLEYLTIPVTSGTSTSGQ